jgi:cellulose synthase (UDP-forming)
MPDLELFANAGFPFTRFADLSQSMFVLPSSASAQEIELYMTLIAYMGEQTGYPALRLSVGDENDLGKDLDYLIIGTQAEQPGLAQLKNRLPVLIQQNGLTVRMTGGFFQSIQERIYEETGEPPHWWRLSPRGERQGLMEALEEVPDAVIQGVKSPWGIKRSIVTITLRNQEATQNFIEAFWKLSMSDDISKHVSVLHGTTFTSYRLQGSYYHVGCLSPLAWMRYWLRGSPWMIALFTLLLGVFIVPWTKQRLDRRARDRIEARDI